MKKYFALLLAMLMVVCVLAACGEEEAAGPAEPTQPASVAAPDMDGEEDYDEEYVDEEPEEMDEEDAGKDTGDYAAQIEDSLIQMFGADGGGYVGATNVGDQMVFIMNGTHAAIFFSDEVASVVAIGEYTWDENNLVTITDQTTGTEVQFVCTPDEGEEGSYYLDLGEVQANMQFADLQGAIELAAELSTRHG